MGHEVTVRIECNDEASDTLVGRGVIAFVMEPEEGDKPMAASANGMDPEDMPLLAHAALHFVYMEIDSVESLGKRMELLARLNEQIVDLMKERHG